MTKLNCQQPLLQSSVSHDPSEIMLKTVVLLNSFVEIKKKIQDSLMNYKVQKNIYLKLIFCNTIKYFTITFDQLIFWIL